MSEPGLTAYDVADHYDDAYFRDLAARYSTRSRFARQRIRNVSRLLPDVRGLRLVDIGCGMGTFTLETARRGAKPVGVDLAPAALEVARSVAASEGLAETALVRADAAALPFAAAAVDLVLAADVTEHLDGDTLHRVLAEARRILRPGGRLVLYTPSPTHMFERLRMHGILLAPEPSHIGMRTADALGSAVRDAGFIVEQSEFLPSHIPLLSHAERAVGRWIPLLRRRIGIVASKPDRPQ